MLKGAVKFFFPSVYARQLCPGVFFQLLANTVTGCHMKYIRYSVRLERTSSNVYIVQRV